MNPEPQYKKVQEHAIVAWEAPMQPTYERSIRWYIGAVVVCTLLLGYSIWTQAWSFTLVLVLLGAVYAWNHRSSQPTKHIAIHEQGFSFGKEFIPWNQCNGFWMLEGPGYVELHFEKKAGRVRDIKIQTGDIDLGALRELLLHFIPEFQERHERFLDMIARLLKI